jgi:hypothetical protein
VQGASLEGLQDVFDERGIAYPVIQPNLALLRAKVPRVALRRPPGTLRLTLECLAQLRRQADDVILSVIPLSKDGGRVEVFVHPVAFWKEHLINESL